MYVVCPHHLDEAIDEFVEVYEMPPDLCCLTRYPSAIGAPPPLRFLRASSGLLVV